MVVFFVIKKPFFIDLIYILELYFKLIFFLRKYKDLIFLIINAEKYMTDRLLLIFQIKFKTWVSFRVFELKVTLIIILKIHSI